MMTPFSTMTPREELRMTGALRPETIERLIDAYEEYSAQDSVYVYCEEATAGFPAEDFLREAINEVKGFAKLLRGENRKEALEIAQTLEGIQTQVSQSAEYGREQLDKAITILTT